VHGVPGGRRDEWDDSDDTAELRAVGEAADRELEERVKALAPVWRREIERQRRQRGRGVIGRSR
jgi:hypothetical protein